MTQYVYGPVNGSDGAEGAAGGDGKSFSLTFTGTISSPADNYLQYQLWGGYGGSGGAGEEPAPAYTGPGGDGGTGGDGGSVAVDITSASFDPGLTLDIVAVGGNAGPGGHGSRGGGHYVTNPDGSSYLVLDNGAGGDAGTAGAGTITVLSSTLSAMVTLRAYGGNGHWGGAGGPTGNGFNLDGSSSDGASGTVTVTNSSFLGETLLGNYINLQARGGSGTFGSGNSADASDGADGTVLFSGNDIDVSAGRGLVIQASGEGGNGAYAPGRDVSGLDGDGSVIFTNNQIMMGGLDDALWFGLSATGGGIAGNATVAITDNTLQGGTGYDVIIVESYTLENVYSGTFSGITFDLSLNDVQGFEEVRTSTHFGTAILGDGAANRLVAVFNNSGGVAHHTLSGRGGNDTLASGNGNDSLDGGDDTDTVSYEQSWLGVSVDLSIATAQDTGGAGIDTLIGFENVTGSVAADTLKGNSGANTLSGGGGDDSLEGSSGGDILDGGADTDTAVASGRFSDYTLSAGANGSIVLTDNRANGDGADTLIGIEGITFSNGTYDVATATFISDGSTAPTVTNAIADQSVDEDTAWTFQVPAGTFSDADGDTMSYSATLADETALPSWLSFDAATGTFSGTPPLNFNGVLSLKVIASDGSLTASDTFDLTVTAANDPPVLDHPVADQQIGEDAPWSFQVPADTFSDVDGNPLNGGGISYSASLGNLDALPSWLTFDAASRTFSGTPPADFNGSLTLRVQASDGQYLASDTFDLVVNSVNRAPTVSNLAGDVVTSTENQGIKGLDIGFDAIVTDMDSANFDGGSLTVAITSALPEDIFFIGSGLPGFAATNSTVSWQGVQFATYTGGGGSVPFVPTGGGTPLVFSFNAKATPEAVQALLRQIAYGNASTDDPTPGTRTVTWTLVDGDGTANGGSDTVTFTTSINVVAINDAPTLATAIADQSSSEDALWTFQVPANVFRDVDGDALGYSATLADGGALPGWLSFDGATHTFSGTPPANISGSLDLKVTAGDGTASANDTFRLTINPVNDAPAVTNLPGEAITSTENQGIKQLDIAFDAIVTDGDSANFAGGSLTIATDAALLEDILFIGNGLPGLTATTSTVSWQGVQFATYTGGPHSGSFVPIGGGSPLVFTFNAEATPEAVQALLKQIGYGNASTDDPTPGTRTVTWTLVDGDGTANGGSDTLTFTTSINVVAINDAPFLASSIPDQSSNEDAPWSFQIPANAFRDPDDALSYSATLGDGTTLPTWLNFDAATRTFSGTPPANFNGTLDLEVTASDGSLSASDTFVLTVNPINDAPTSANLAGDIVTATENQGNKLLDVGFDAAIADIDSTNFDGGSLTVAITAALPEDGLFISDQLGITSTSSTVSFQGVQFATYTGGGYGGGPLVFTFDADASAAAVQTLAQRILYSNASTDDPTAGTRTVTWTLIDGDGTANGGSDTLTFTTSVNVVALNDGPNAPVDSDGPSGATVAEDLIVGSPVAIDADATDVDGDTLSYYFKDGSGNRTQTLGKFTIAAATGVVTLAVALDYETATSHSLTVYASDGTEESSSNFTVNVTDVAENPFTGGNDGSLTGPVDFNQLTSPFYNSGTGDDFIILPDPGTGAGGSWDYAQTFDAGPGNDLVQGGDGGDKINGGDGTDRLFGGGGNDTLNGGTGLDFLIGGPGADRLTGGGSADVFIFTESELSTTKAGPHDVITDFQTGTDKIDISALYEDHAVGRVGSGKASDATKLSNYDVKFYTEAGKTYVIGDTNGVAGADFTIELTGSIKLKAGDFITSSSGWPATPGGYDYDSLHQDSYWLV